MKRLIRRYIRKRIWKCNAGVIGPAPRDYDEKAEWVMLGYPLHWRTRLWAVVNSRPHQNYKEVYEWITG